MSIPTLYERYGDLEISVTVTDFWAIVDGLVIFALIAAFVGLFWSAAHPWAALVLWAVLAINTYFNLRVFSQVWEYSQGSLTVNGKREKFNLELMRRALWEMDKKAPPSDKSLLEFLEVGDFSIAFFARRSFSGYIANPFRRAENLKKIV